MKIYISGPITGMPNENIEAFKDAELRLKAAGFEVVNPHENGLSKEAPWLEHLKMDIRLMMDCDALCMLPGWQRSRGAKVENSLAESLGYPIKVLEAWL